jgi:zinc protease
VRASEPPQIAARRLLMEDARVRQASWMRSYLAPTLQAGESRFALPLVLLAEILGGGPSSRLNKALVLDSGIAIAASAGYDESGIGLGTFDLFARPKPGVGTAEVEAKIDAVLADLVAKGVSAAELERAKIDYRAGTIYARDSLDSTARLFGEALATGLTIADVEAMPARMQAVSLQQVDEAARFVFDIRKSVTGVLLPKPAS